MFFFEKFQVLYFWPESDKNKMFYVWMLIFVYIVDPITQQAWVVLGPTIKKNSIQCLNYVYENIALYCLIKAFQQFVWW